MVMGENTEIKNNELLLTLIETSFFYRFLYHGFVHYIFYFNRIDPLSLVNFSTTSLLV